MNIEHIHIKNFRALRDVELPIAAPLAVFIGENGSGKSTLFSIFGFLKTALHNNVTIALQELGGYREVVTRGCEGEPIVIQMQFRMDIADVNRLVTYHLEIAVDEQGLPFIQLESMEYMSGEGGRPACLLEFRKGEGYAISETGSDTNGKTPATRPETLAAANILAIKGLGQFQNYPAASAICDLIENWHVSDFHTDAVRPWAEVGVAEHLSESGDNLLLATLHLYKNDPDTFNRIVNKFKDRIPSLSKVEIKVTEDRQVLLYFKDEAFTKPFTVRHMSDGTIKLFAYLVLLNDPKPHPLLCIDEPENQIYPALLDLLVDDLQAYARRGGQVFVFTHSPDLLNYIEIEELYRLEKQHGVTKILPIAADENIRGLVDAGDKLGWLWNQGLLAAEHGEIYKA